MIFPTNQPTTWTCPWEADIHSANQEIPHLSHNLKVHKSLPLVPILNNMHPVHTFPPYFPKIHSNIIFPPTSKSSKWSLPIRFSNKKYVHISQLSHECYMPSPSQHWLGDPNIWGSVQVMKFLIMHYAFPILNGLKQDVLPPLLSILFQNMPLGRYKKWEANWMEHTSFRSILTVNIVGKNINTVMKDT